MAGLLTHLIIAALCLLVVHLIHFKWEFSWAVFAGNFIPDVIKFGFSALKQGTLAVFSANQDSFFQVINQVTSSYVNWLSVGFFVFSCTLLLYHFHFIKKKKMEEYDELYVFLLAGIIIHLILDALIIETSPWL